MLKAVLLLTSVTLSQAEDEIIFNRDIRPILSEKCFHCHGPDENTREAKLRLDVAEVAYAEAIVPHSLEKSELWERVITDDEDDLMPPPESDKPLTPKEIGLLKRWIEGGAEYQDHWAFIAPVRADIGEATSAIDHFVDQGINRTGVKKTKPADRSILLRRLSLDLTGLPPTQEELAAFLSDNSPEAIERQVDRLLASPRYGEHMSRFWLDAVRYGDTHGLHLDNYREFWPYRDWVIDAFNTNKPWDDFIVEQLAGDLLENPTVAQIVATGYNRAHVTTAEGGSIKEEVHVRNVADRVATFGTVMLGLTTECAACHDHKFDPISQKEYYQLFAYFNSLDANPMDGNKKDHAPVVRVASKEDEQRLAKARSELEEEKEKLAEAIASYPYQEPEEVIRAEPVETVWIDDGSPAGAKLEGRWNWVDQVEGEPVFSGTKATAQSGDGLIQHVLQGSKEPLVIAEDTVLFAHVFLAEKAPEQIMLQFHAGRWEHRAYWGGNKINWGKNDTPSRLRKGDLPASGQWVRLEVTAAEVGLKPGDKINGWAFTQFGGTAYWDKSGMVGTSTGYRSLRQWLADERGREKSDHPGEIADLLKKPADQLKSAEKERLRNYYVEHIDVTARKQFDPVRRSIAGKEQAITSIEKGFPTSLVWKELAKPKPAYILERGQYDRKSEEPVGRSLPAFLPPLPEGNDNDRLGVARWLVADNHPLTARVAVNRFWQQLFGVGLVKTAEDFGSQGEWPSHPELLDWLAVEFRESGWDVKQLIKLVMLSETYQQSSVAPAQSYKKDPENRLLARGPRFRLDAETLRDQALAVSGLLVEQIGGPGVRPPQPDGLWKAVGYQSSNTVRFVADKGPDKVHRRSLYTFWKRTSPPPQMIDAPSRESCVVRRERTNTPLHALMFMNDPQYVEAARCFAERFIELEDETIPGKLLGHGLLRTGTEDELTLLQQSYQEHLAHYREHPDQAKSLIAIGESPSESAQPERLAAWTMVASLVLNLDEFVTKN